MSTAPARTLLQTLSRPSRTSLPRWNRSISSLIRTRPKAVQQQLSSTSTTSYSQQDSSSTRKPRERSFPLTAGVGGVIICSIGYYFFSSSSSGSSEQVLAPDRWTSVEIESVERLTRDTSLFKIRVPKTILPQSLNSLIKDDDRYQPILSLFVKEPTLQIQRAYTPLSSKSFDPNGDGSTLLELVVKRYRDGEVSRYLHRLGPRDRLEVRAPSVTWLYRPRDWDRVVFIAGGTGVTPAFQCLNDSTTDSPQLSLIYASSSESEIFLKPQLDQLLLKQGGGGRISKIEYKLDKLDFKSLENFLGRNQNDNNENKKRTVVVVCGPEGMIETVAGPRGRNFSQGPVGGILKQLGYTEDQVVKL
ncbi:hypothetical protein JCM3765_004540 [Sporobolomyces pararoseus]